MYKSTIFPELNFYGGRRPPRFPSDLSVGQADSDRKRRCFRSQLPGWVSTLNWKFFCAVALMNGLDLTTDRRKSTERRFRIGLLAIRAVNSFALGFYASFRLVYTWIFLPDSPSASDLFWLVYVANDIALRTMTVWQLWTNQTKLRLAFPRARQRCLSLKISLFWILLCFGITARAFVSHQRACAATDRTHPYLRVPCVLSWFGSVYTGQVSYLSVILLLEGGRFVTSGLRRIDRQLARGLGSSLVREKDHVRKVTAALNSAFGSIIAQMYMSMFALIYVTVMNEVLAARRRNLLRRIARYNRLLLQLVALYMMAATGSEVIRLCQQTAHRAKTRRCSSVGVDDVDSRFRRQFAFDEQIDCLKILDCFVHSTPTFITYLTSLITCLGLLLQFDYKLMAVFDRCKLAMFANGKT